MSNSHVVSRTVLLSAVAVAALSLSACCKGDKKEEAKPASSATASAAPAATSAAAADTAATNPDWKTKCPDAERPMSGTVSTKITLKILEKPDPNSKKLSTISPGTWVDLLGAKGNWYCIDYPCGVGKLCPGWIMSSYTKRKPPKPKQDAGTTKDAGAEKKDAGAKKDAAADKKDAGAKKDAAADKKDAGAKKDAGKKKGGLRLIPGLKLKLPNKK